MTMMTGIPAGGGADSVTMNGGCTHLERICDVTPATAHFRLAGHPVVRWYEPGEDWYWCYLDRLVFELEGAPAAPSHL